MKAPNGASHRSGRPLRLSGAVLVALLWAATAAAQPIIFTDFDTTGGLRLTSSTTKQTTAEDGKVLRLVTTRTNDIGAAFTTSQLKVTSGFSTAFDFRITNPGGSSDGTRVGADGFVFVIQNSVSVSSVSDLGGTGEYLGYGSASGGIPKSIGIEIDTYQNAAAPRLDPSSNHIGINVNGSVDSITGRTANISPDFDNGTKWSAWIDYNGSILEVRLSNNGVRPSQPSLSYSISSTTFASSSFLGGTNAWVGFTAATGGAYENIDIVAWTFSDTFFANGVTAGMAIPEPSTYALMALGLGWMWVRRRSATRAR